MLIYLEILSVPASQVARRENIEKINVCKLSFFLRDKIFSSLIGSGLSKAEHDHENVAKSKAGRLQRFMWDQVGTKCEQFCRKITGNLC